MGKRGPKPKYTGAELADRRRERNRVRHWTDKGLDAPPLGAARARNGSPEAAANAKAHAKAHSAVHKRRRQDRNRAFILAHKLTHPCIDCGYSDPRALAFDHRDRVDKLADVSRLVTQGLSIARLEAEMAKCDVRCANCHTIRSQEESHWDRVW